MRTFPTQIGAGLLLATTSSVALAQSQSATAIPVTVDNYNRAESDVYLGLNVKSGGFGKFLHTREPVPVDNQGVIRPNRDTLYSAGVFDLDTSPVTVTLPDAGKRFMSMQVERRRRRPGSVLDRPRPQRLAIACSFAATTPIQAQEAKRALRRPVWADPCSSFGKAPTDTSQQYIHHKNGEKTYE